MKFGPGDGNPFSRPIFCVGRPRPLKIENLVVFSPDFLKSINIEHFMKHFLVFLMSSVVVLAAVAACDDTSYTTSTAPSITLNESTLKVSYEGGDYGFGYSVSYPADDGVLSVECEDDWIENIDCSADDTVTFTVALQEERVARKTTLSVKYTYGDSVYVEETFTIRQTLNNYYELAAAYAGGTYYGIKNNASGTSAVEYSIWLSDQDTLDVAGGTYYYFDIWSDSEPDDLDNIILQSGTDTLGTLGTAGEFSIENSKFFIISEDGASYDESYTFVSGSLVVSASTSDGTTITAELEDENGGVHEVSFSGDLVLANDGYMTSLDEDLELGDISSSVECEAKYFGDYYGSGTANWVLVLYDDDVTGFTVDYCGDADCTYDAGEIPCGTFEVAASGGESGTFYAGTLSFGYLAGTWLVTLSDGALAEPYAPVVDGTVTVTAGSTDGEYTIAVEGTDDLGNVVSGSWTGTPTLVDAHATKAGRALKARVRF